jgi:peptidoglycan/LPS O-acetylase OafA/YrhL
MQTKSADTSDRMPLLDALRLFAAFLVLGFHWLFRGPASGDQFTPFRDFEALAIYGYIGVDWFFVISGFVIAWTAQSRSAVNFAILRFARLYPAYIACMSLTFLLTVLYGWQRATPGLADWVANLTMAAPLLGRPFMDGAYWSILVEIIFYGWVFLLLAGGLWKYRVPITFGWLALSIANMTWLEIELLRFLLITDFAPWFIIGMMMHDMRERGLRLASAVILVTAFIASCLSLTIQVPEFLRDYGAAPDLSTLFGLNAIGVLLVALAVQPWQISQRLSRIAMFAGAISYPLYLLHQHAGYMLIDRLGPKLGAWPAFALSAAAVIFVAAATTELIERPLRPVIVRHLSKLVAALGHSLKSTKSLNIKKEGRH